MSVTRAAIDKNRVTFVLLLVLAVMGLSAYNTMPRAEDPGFIVRTAVVIAHFPGASPERVEQLVTDKLEKAIQEMPEVDTLRSQSKTGVSIINVDIRESYTEMRPIWDSLRRKVDSARGDLPDAVRGPTVNDEFGDVFGTMINLTGDGFSYAELREVADNVRDELLLIPEAAKVEIHGIQPERVFVEYNNARLAELGLTPLQLKDLLESRNIINPGGDIRTENEQIVLEPTGNFESVEDLRRTIITLPGRDELIYLGDVAEINRDYIDPPTLRVRGSGTPALVLAVSLREGGNILTLGAAVQATLDRVVADLPVGVEFEISQFQAGEVEKKVSDFVGNLFQAVVIVLLVMLFSLGVRTGLVVASLIPMAIVVSFVFMSAFGVGIDQMSLAALIIALGMLVDNAIVMSESILVSMSEGKGAVEAAVESAGELRIPLLTSSLTTAAAFLPIYLAESAVGEYTAPLFQVVTITLLCSWALSLTMIPVLCVLFLKVKQVETEGEEYDSRFYRLYRRFLLLLLRNRLASVVVVALIFFGVMQLGGLVPVLFFPPNDRPTFTAELLMPTGTPLEATERVAIQVEEFLKEEVGDQVTSWSTFIGAGAPRFVLSYAPEQSSPDYAILVGNTTTREATDQVVEQLRAFTDTIPGLKAKVDPLPNGPPAANPIEVRISGRKEGELFQLVEKVKRQLAQTPGARNLSDNWGARSKKLLVRIDETRAQLAGVSNQDVAISLQTLLSGFTTTEYREGDKIIPVVMRSVQSDRADLGKLESLNVFSQLTGRSVPLKQVADLEVAWQPAKVWRRNRLKTVTVAADLEPGYTAAQVNAQLTLWLEEESASWPLGYSWELGGEDEESSKANASIVAKLPIAGLIILLLLVGQFNSLRKPLIILITIPLGLIGVILGLLILNSYFGFMTFLGVISLAGVVINNAIVLLDRIRIEIEDNGLEPPRAVVMAAQRRLRPILLTTFTTLGGLIPLYLGGGAMFQPMAVAIMFGLVFATLLTLGVVPVLYALFYRVSYSGFEW